MNKKIRPFLKLKILLSFLFVICCIGTICVGGNVSADENKRDVEATLLINEPQCSYNGNGYNCTMSGVPVSVTKNYCEEDSYGNCILEDGEKLYEDGQRYRVLLVEMSSSFGPTQSFQVGIIKPEKSYEGMSLPVIEPKYFYYNFFVSNDYIKNNYSEEYYGGGKHTWYADIAINIHFFMRFEYETDDTSIREGDSYEPYKFRLGVVEIEQYMLTGVPVDGQGNEISNISRVYSPLVNYGSMAQITRIDATGDDYAFVGWKDTLTGNITQTSPTYTESFMTGNKTVYAVYRKIERFILTGIPVDVNGNEISSIPKVYSSPTDYGLSAYIVRADASGDGYSFMGWRDVPTGVYTQTGTTYTEQQMIGDKTVYAVYEKNTIVGKVDASSASGTDTTDWSSSDKIISHSIVNCPSSGCDGTFVHRLKTTGGGGMSHYKIFRESGDNPGVSNMIKEGDYSGKKGVDSLVMTNTIGLTPGNKICETLVFDASLGLGNNDVSLTMCILALGDAQGDETLLSIKVKNNQVDKYNSYQDLVYAKPGDVLEFYATYIPRLQKVYKEKPQKIQINGGTIYPTSNINTTLTFGELFNTYKGSGLANWNNAFSMRSENYYEDNYSIVFGGDEEKDFGNPQKMEARDQHKVVVDDREKRKSEAGRELIVYAEMNKNDGTKSSPTSVTYVIDSDGNNVGNVKIEEKEVSAKAIVPFNFGTKVSLKKVDTGDVNIGEQMNVEYSIELTPKTNRETSPKDAYETIASYMRGGAVFYIKDTADNNNDNDVVWEADKDVDLCSYFGMRDDDGATCDVKSRTWGSTEESYHGIAVYDGWNGENASFNVPDGAVGREVCVAAAVYPNSSYPDYGSDYEHKSLSKNGDGQWHISKSECFTIGKKPTFQVWGGSVYASNDITTLSTTKRVISGGSLNGERVAFSSWVEGIVIANGKATGIASGAATGKSNSPAGSGSVEKDVGSAKYYCTYRVPLSIANYLNNRSSGITMCPDDEITGYSSMVVNDLDAELIIKMLKDYRERHKDDEKKEISITIDDSNTVVGSRDVSIGEVFVFNNPGKDIRISGDIKYHNGPYANMSQIPKVIINAKNISIDCEVKNIDAILIAKENINTCADISSEDVNNEGRSNQLTIRGALVAGGTIEFNRTYGAGAGKESGTPAEIINYDTTIPLWQKNILLSDGYDTLTSVYQHELAPRY